MKGKVVQYRRGRKTQYKYQMILEVEGVDTKEKAQGLLGKKVIYKTPSGKEIKGEITRVHGCKGRVVARFEKGLPGQALSQEVEIA